MSMRTGPMRHTRDPEPRGRISLTPRLRKTLDLVVDGRTDREIGVALGLTSHGADALSRRLRDLFGVPTRAQVVAEAFRRGFVK
jgi:two-component system nitrate/nitrite response regulator NarL